jgi:ubiquinone/menaquinone biosynthesis C-methylase UbiE
MNFTPTYDRIGVGYSKHRHADRRLVDAIIEQLRLDRGSVIADIGAGSGNYSMALAERGFRIKAIEPSAVMRGQAIRHPGIEWLPGVAEAVPLATDAVDGVICILASHHFPSLRDATLEMMRVSRGPILMFTYDPRVAETLWLQDYFGEIFAGSALLFPSIDEVCELFAAEGLRATAVAFPLPHDLEDLFLAAAWRRPELYLDPGVRACISGFALADDAWVDSRIERLRTDLQTGLWHQKYGAVLDRQEIDAGYRFVAAHA